MQKKKEKEKQLDTIMQRRETEHQIPTWEVLSQQKQLSKYWYETKNNKEYN